MDDGLDELAAALDANRDSFSATDGQWLTRIASAILRLANRTLPDTDLALTMHCEALLSVAGQARSRATSVVSTPDISSATAAAATTHVESNALQRPTNKADQETDVTPITSSDATSAAENAFSASPQSAYETIASPAPRLPIIPLWLKAPTKRPAGPGRR